MQNDHFAFRCLYYRIVSAEASLGSLISISAACYVSGIMSYVFAVFGVISLLSGFYFWRKANGLFDEQ